METLFWILFGGAGVIALTGCTVLAVKLGKNISAKRAAKIARETELLKQIAERNKAKGLTPTQLKDMAREARREQDRAERAERKRSKKFAQVKDALVEKGAAFKDNLKEKHAQFKEAQAANKKAYDARKQIDIDKVKLASETDSYFRKIIDAKTQEATALREKGVKNLNKEEKARLAQLEKEIGTYLAVNSSEPPLKEPKAKKVKEVVAANVPTIERDQYTNDIMNIKHARYEELLTKGRKKLNVQEKEELNTLHQEIEEFLEKNPTYEFESGDLTQAPNTPELERRAPARPTRTAQPVLEETQAETATQENEVEQAQDHERTVANEIEAEDVLAEQIQQDYDLPPSVVEKVKKGNRAINTLKALLKKHPELSQEEILQQEEERIHDKFNGTPTA